ncbi:MAG: monovalent cation/H(+) antiporter subunit G [Candidatus Omnitrophota bacterium]
MSEMIGTAFIVIGLGFNIIGCIGIARFPDFYSRIQAAIKCVTFGTCLILFGTFILKGFSTAGVKAIVTALFLVFTAPVASHALARAVRKSGLKEGRS